jgi:hypothetical protein
MAHVRIYLQLRLNCCYVILFINFFIFLNHFNILILKIKTYNFNSFLCKIHFKKQNLLYFQTSI